MWKLVPAIFLWVAVSREGVELGSFTDYRTCMNYVIEYDGDCFGREMY